MTNDNFGKGIFDDDITDEAMSDTTTPEPDSVAADEPESIELTEKQKAFARAPLGTSIDDIEIEEEPAPLEKNDPEPDWSASDKRLAKHHGITDEDLDAFDTPGSFHAAIDLLEARKEAAGKITHDPPRDAGSPPADGSSDAEPDGGTVSDILGFEKTDVEAAKAKYNALDDDGDRIFDEATAEILIGQEERSRRLEDALEKSLQQSSGYAEQSQQAEAEENVRQFNKALDDVPGMYGSGDSRSTAHDDARMKVAEHLELLYQGHLAKGGEIPPVSELVEQSVQAIHGAEYAEAQRRVDTLKKHSAKRRSPGSKVTPSPTRSADYDPESAEAIANRPALVEVWESMQLDS